MKFEMIEPPEDAGDDAWAELPHPADAGPKDHAPPLFHQHPNDVLARPVGQRMTKAVDGFRASLKQLKAHVAAKSMAEAHEQARQIAAVDTEVAPEAVFHPHRFSGTKTVSGQEGDR